MKTTNNDTTIVDIAKELGLSLSTVSRALSGYPHVQKDTRKKVLDLAEKLNYRRNILASGLRNNRTFSIGLIVPRISMYYHSVVITCIQNELFKHGYNLVICQSNDEIKMEKELVKALYNARMDAVIAACTLQTTSFSHFDTLVKNNIPLVFYDRVPTKDFPAFFVCGDDFQGGYLGTSHLIETGCKRIAHISGPLTSNLYQDRSAGYKKALEQNGIVFEPELLFCHELTVANARQTLAQLFKQRPYPDAIFAANDTTAIAVIDFVKEIGLSIPKDLKLVGYSNDPRSEIVTPSITSIEQHPEEVGKLVVKNLLSMLDDKEKRTELIGRINIPVQLIRRMSS